MDDYISREAALAAMTALRQEDIEAFGVEIPECFPAESAIEALNKIPAVDVVKVVRCRDCAHYNRDSWLCENRYGLPFAHPAKYCSMGVRREEDGD